MSQSLVDKVQRAIQSNRLLSPGTHVLLAVSGGLDSMVMMDVFLALSKRMKLRMTVGHVHHGLRGGEATRDQRFVRRMALDRGVRFSGMRVSVPSVRARRGGSIEEVARELRYAALDRMRRRVGASVIATAHHADDQAETVVLRAVRGSDVWGLAGILPTRSDLPVVRPMLACRRSEIEEYARLNGVAFREDSSNRSLDIRRNALRHRDLSTVGRLVGIDPGSTLPRFAEVARKLGRGMESVLDSFVEEVSYGSAKASVLLDARLSSLPARYRTSVIAGWLRRNGVEVTRGRIASIQLLRPAQAGKKVVLKGSKVAIYKERNGLSLAGLPDFPAQSQAIGPGSHVKTPLGVVRVSGERRKPPSYIGGNSTAWIDLEKSGKKLSVRTWKSSDRIRPLGMAGTKKVSDVLTDAKVPSFARSGIPVVLSGRKIVWVCGIRPSDDFKITASTRTVLQLTFHSSVLRYGTDNRRQQRAV